MQSIQLLQMEGKELRQQLALHKGDKGAPLRIKATADGKFILADKETGTAPENITVRRVGKNLLVCLEGDALDQPTLIIEDFFEYDSELMGMAEDGAYYAYVSSDGDDDHAAALLLEDGQSSALVLGGEQVGSLEETAAFGLLPWVAGGILGVGGGAAALGRGKGGGSDKTTDASQPLPPETAPEPETPAPVEPTPGSGDEGHGIKQIIDDQGPIQGVIEKGGVTDDTTPTLNGSGNPGDTVIILDNGKPIGETVVDDNGNWTYTPETDLGEGEHEIGVIIEDKDGNQSRPDDTWVVIVDTQAPDAPVIGGVYDDVGAVTGPLASGALTDDAQPTLTGRAEAGSTVIVYDNGNKLGETRADANGNWSFTPAQPLAEGEHSFTVRALDAAGNLSEPSQPWDVLLDVTPPAKPGTDGEGPGIGEIIDDQGPIQGPIGKGDVTDDSTPTLGGTGEPGDTVIIRDGDEEIGRVEIDDEGNWSFTPDEPLGEGEHDINVIIQDPAGNQSDPSDPWVVVVDTQAPDAPSIGSVYDDVGNVTGALASGDSTDDQRPTFSGQAEAGSIVSLYDGEQKLGEVVADENGNWSFTPEEPLSEGEHSFTVRAQDAAGNLSEPSQPWEVVIDTTAPGQPGIGGEGPGIGEVIDDQGPIQGPIENGGITDDTTPTFNGTGEPGDTIIIRDGEEEIGRVEVDDNGNWSFTPDEPLGEGDHAINVIIQDPAGNQSDPSDPWVVTVDTQAPDAPVIGSILDAMGDKTGPLEPGDITDDNRPTINGSAEPGSTVVVYDHGQRIGQAQADANGNWSLKPEQPLPAGEHAITAKAQDAAGNLSEPSPAFDFSLMAPGVPGAPAIVSVTDNVGPHQGALQKGDVTDDARPTVYGSAEPGSTITVYSNGAALGTTIADAEGQWAFTPATDLPEGLNKLTATATNAAGNASHETGAFELLVDTSAPAGIESGELLDDVGNIQGPIANGDVTDDAQPTFTGQAEPHATVVIYDGGQKIGETHADANGNWSFTPATALSDGEHSLSAQVFDPAGNASAVSDAITFSVDTRQVEVSIDAVFDDFGSKQGPISKGGVTDDSTPSLSGRATPDSTVVIYDNGIEIGRIHSDANGNWSFTPEVALAEGAHALSATVITEAGGESAPTPAFDFHLDTSAPEKPGTGGEGHGIGEVIDDVGAIQGPIENGGSTDDSTPTFNGTGEPGDTVHVYDQGGLLGSVEVKPDGSWSFTPPPLVNGEHQVTVVIEDPAGNRSEPSDPWVVIVDTQAPDVPSIGGVYDDVGNVTGALASGDSTDDTQPTFSGQAEAGSIVSIYDGEQKLGEVEADENGNWSFTPEEPLTEGEHSFTVRAQDAAGNLSEPSAPWEVVIDTTAPTKPGTDGEGLGISGVIDDQGPIQGPIENGGITDDTTPTFNGTGEPGDTIIIRDGEQEIGRVEIGEDGTWSFTPDEPLGEGEHAINVIIQDKAGNQSEPSDPWVVTVDTQSPDAPSIGGVFDDAGAVTGELASGDVTDDAQPTFSGQAEAGSIVSIYDGEQKLGEVVADENGSWSFAPEEPLAEGGHSFTVRAQDAAGNLSEPSASWDLVIDTQAPDAPSIGGVFDDVGEVTGALASGDATDDQRPTLSGQAEAGSIVSIFDGEQKLGEVLADENGSWTFTPEEPLADGQHSFTVKAVDAAGNVSDASAAWLTTIVTQAPEQPSIESVTDDVGPLTGALHSGDLTDDSRPQISGRSEPGNTVRIYDRGVEIGSVQADDQGNWSFTPESELADGEYSFTAVAENAAGTRSPASEAFELIVYTGNGPTQVARLSHMGKDSGQDGNDFVTDNGTYGRLMYGALSAELNAGQTLQVSTDGGRTWFDALVDGTNWAVQDRSAHSGSWTIQTRVVDQAGNPGYVMQQAVVLDTVAPRAPSSIQLDGTHLLVGFDPANVAVGDRIAVIADGGIQRFEHTLTQADIAAGSVTLEVGSIGSASAALVDQAGNLSGFANTDAAPSVNYLLSGDVTEIYGQGRDNVFSVANVCVLEQIKVIEGNAGVDTLKLTGADQVLDLSALQGRLSSIEVIDLTGTGDNTLKVSLGDVLDLGNQRSFINDDNVQLAVKGNAGDVVMLSDLLPNGMDVGDWENLGQVTAAGIVYEVYQHTGLEAEILVQQGVTVQTL
jgi:Tfp pilus assembly protein PilP